MNDRCKGFLRNMDGWTRRQQCTAKATRDGYCGVHHPASVKVRRAKVQAKYAAKSAYFDGLADECRERERKADAYDAITADIARLTERVRELDADANRYRWIRQAGAWESELGIDDLSKDPAKFDAAVDERIATSALAKREG